MFKVSQFQSLVFCILTHVNCRTDPSNIIAFPLVTNHSACCEKGVLLALYLLQWKLTFKSLMSVVFCLGGSPSVWQSYSGNTWTPSITSLHIKSKFVLLKLWSVFLFFCICTPKVIQQCEMLSALTLSYVRWCLGLQYMRFLYDQAY